MPDGPDILWIECMMITNGARLIPGYQPDKTGPFLW